MTAVVRSESGPKGVSAEALRAMPRTVSQSLRLLWRAGPATFAAGASLQVMAGLGIAVQLLVGRELLEAVLVAARPGASSHRVAPWLVALVAVTVVLNLASTGATFVQRLLTERTMKHVQGQVLDAASAVDLATFESAEFFDQMQRAGSQSVIAPLQISMQLLAMISSSVGLVGIVIALATIAPPLVPLVLLGYLPLWYAAAANGAAMAGFAFGQTANDRARQAVQRVLTNRASAGEVRAFGIAPMLRARWDALYEERIADAAAVASARWRRSSLAGVGSSLASAVVYVALVWMLIDGRIDVAAAATAALAVQQLGSRLTGVTGGIGSIYESAQFLGDTLAFFERIAAESRPLAEAAPAPAAFDRLTVDDLHFRYPGSDREALGGVSMELRRGEIIALVGENGSGKTTLAKILAGLYAPSGGSVRWDDLDVRDLDPAAVRERIAVTFQDFVRYPLDGWENIGVGRVAELADRDGVRQAAETSGAASCLDALPRGFDTLLSKEFEGGEDLSVGQWQRIALARAFFRDAPFIILDEPTAALDPRAEYELFAAIRELFKGRTVLLISHRFSSVRAADRIYVLHEGEITEHGTHDELMAGAGRYAELFTMQASAYLDAAPTTSSG